MEKAPNIHMAFAGKRQVWLPSSKRKPFLFIGATNKRQ
ncbi:hypothetical protein BSM4216_0184 [Bacillus smithii]|nr:hypothetical protein BSM4216_0184 [Bacillus smithii]